MSGAYTLRWNVEQWEEFKKRIPNHPLVETVRAEPLPEKIKSRTLKYLLHRIQEDRLPEPVVEHRFHSIRKWRFDLAWPDQKIGLEVHGAVYRNGHHTRGKGFEDDREKANEAQVLGWTVLEYSTGQVKHGAPIIDLKRILRRT